MADIKEVQAAVDQAAEAIATQRVQDWQRAIRYLLRKLDKAAADSGRDGEFQKLLFEVREDITTRISLREW